MNLNDLLKNLELCIKQMQLLEKEYPIFYILNKGIINETISDLISLAETINTQIGE